MSCGTCNEGVRCDQQTVPGDIRSRDCPSSRAWIAFCCIFRPILRNTGLLGAPQGRKHWPSKGCSVNLLYSFERQEYSSRTEASVGHGESGVTATPKITPEVNYDAKNRVVRTWIQCILKIERFYFLRHEKSSYTHHFCAARRGQDQSCPLLAAQNPGIAQLKARWSSAFKWRPYELYGDALHPNTPPATPLLF